MNSEFGVGLLIKEAELLYTYVFFDHATEILDRPKVHNNIESELDVSTSHIISEIAANFNKRSQSNWLRRS